MKTVEKYLYKISYWIFDNYYRLRNYIFRGEYQKKHIIFQKDGSQIKISIKSHEDFVEEKQKIIDGYKKKKNENAFIKHGLQQALDGCNYIIFSKSERFVQYWTSKGSFDFNLPTVKASGNRPFYYQTLGLLVDMNFVPESLASTQVFSFKLASKNNSYAVNKNDELNRINGYFGKQTDLATEFVLRMFKEIYKTKKGEIKIEVG